MTENEALLKVAEGLESGEYVHVGTDGGFAGLTMMERLISEKKKFFNMNSEELELSCGTVRCIGGWVGHLLGQDSWNYCMNVFKTSGKGLYSLYYPDIDEDVLYEEITTEQAAKAIRNYLERGDPDWEEVLSEGSDG